MGNKFKKAAAVLLIAAICAGCNNTSTSSDNEGSSNAVTSGGSSAESSNSASSVISSPQSSSDNSSGSADESTYSSSDIGTSSGIDSSSTPEESSVISSVSSTSSVIHSSSSVQSSSATPSSSASSSTGSTSFSSSTNSSSSVTPSSSSTVTPPIPIEPIDPDDPIQSRIAEMTLKERVYQMFFVNPEQVAGGYPVLTPVDLTAKPVGGILYMGANLKCVSQTRNMLTKTQENALKSGIGVFLAVDEEGGLVARCASKLGTTEFEGMAYYGERNDSAEAFNIGKTIGADLSSLGFNVDFAPVADVDICPYNELGNRIFSSDPNVVANMVSNVVRGLNSSGVAATLKHFPGLGAENGNTHTASAIVIDRTLEQLRSEEFVPFKSGISAGAEFVMVGHQQVTAFGDKLPADLSYKAVTEMLRGELGFNGIAITDSQAMNTISNLYYSRTAAALSVKAGIDMILMPQDLDDAVNGVHNALLSGDITESRVNESVTRILTLKQKMGLLS